MNFTTLISTEALARHLSDPQWVVFDCRFSLADQAAGINSYNQGHIVNARYVHLENDLSSPITETSGRHPLPDFTVLAEKLGSWGLTNSKQAIVYDDAGGAFAGRMWWLLRSVGHTHVAVLDGGINQWQKENRGLTTSPATPDATSYRGYPNNSTWLSVEQLQQQLARETIKLIDARTSERYSGKQEPIDAVAGHIPGALNRPFQSNLNSDGLFLNSRMLRQQFLQLLYDTRPENTVHMCGSGVTACHNLLAMEIAGLAGSKLYAGSWSEWIKDSNRPVATTY